MNNLNLVVTGHWFEMTKSGVKTEDYREITPYWAARLFNKQDKGMTIHFWKGFLMRKENNKYVSKFRSQEQIENTIEAYGFKPLKYNIMTLGYPKSTDTDRILKLEHKGIEIRTGSCRNQ